jgi:hypothetical protein
MTDAERIEIEARRDELTARAYVLEGQAPELAYQIAVYGSFIARQKLRALEWECSRICEEISILSASLVYAAKLSGQRDASEVMKELKLMGATTNER